MHHPPAPTKPRVPPPLARLSRLLPALVAGLLGGTPATASAAPTGPLARWAEAHGAALEAAAQQDWRAASHQLTAAEELAGTLDPAPASWLGLGDEAAGPTHPEVPLYGPLAETRRALSRIREAAGDLPGARAAAHRWAEALERAGPVGADALRQAWRREADLAEAAGDHEAAVALVRRQLADLAARRRRREPIEEGDVWTLRVHLGRLLGHLGRRAEALEALRAAATMPQDERPAIAGEAAAERLLLRSLSAHARHLGHPEAERWARLARLVSDGPPPDADWEALHEAGLRARRHQDIDGAARLLRRAADHAAATSPASPLHQAASLEALAGLSRWCRGCALPPPVPLLRTAHGLRSRTQGRRHPDTLDTLAALTKEMGQTRGGVAPDDGQLLRALERLEELRVETSGPASRAAGEAALTLANLHLTRERFAAAAEVGQRALARLVSALDLERAEDRTLLDRAYFQQAACYRAQGRWDQVAAVYHQQLTDLERAYGAGNLRVAWRRLSLGEALANQGRWDDAAAPVQAALGSLRRSGPVLALQTALGLAARVAKERGQAAEAADLEAQRGAWDLNLSPLETLTQSGPEGPFFSTTKSGTLAAQSSTQRHGG